MPRCVKMMSETERLWCDESDMAPCQQICYVLGKYRMSQKMLIIYIFYILMGQPVQQIDIVNK